MNLHVLLVYTGRRESGTHFPFNKLQASAFPSRYTLRDSPNLLISFETLINNSILKMVSKMATTLQNSTGTRQKGAAKLEVGMNGSYFTLRHNVVFNVCKPDMDLWS